MDEAGMDRFLATLQEEAEDIDLAEQAEERDRRDEADGDGWPNWRRARPAQRRRLAELTSPAELARMPGGAAAWLISFLEGLIGELAGPAGKATATRPKGKANPGTAGKASRWTRKPWEVANPLPGSRPSWIPPDERPVDRVPEDPDPPAEDNPPPWMDEDLDEDGP